MARLSAYSGGSIIWLLLFTITTDREVIFLRKHFPGSLFRPGFREGAHAVEHILEDAVVVSFQIALYLIKIPVVIQQVSAAFVRLLHGHPAEYLPAPVVEGLPGDDGEYAAVDGFSHGK